PFGPTMAVMGSGNEIDVFSTNDLNPQISMRLIFIGRVPSRCGTRIYPTGHESELSPHDHRPGGHTCAVTSRSAPRFLSSRETTCKEAIPTLRAIAPAARMLMCARRWISQGST